MGLKLDNKKWLLLIILFSILIRIPYFNCPLFMDEGEYAYQAYLWLNEGISFYKSHLFNMLPGFPLLYAFVFKTLGPTPFSLRFFLAIWNAATVFFIYLTAKKLTDESIALISSFLYACFSSLPLIKGNVGKEIFMLLPLTISLYCYLLYHDSLKRWALFLCGFFSGLAIVFKQSSLPFGAFFLIFLYLRSPNKIKDIFIFLFGSVLPVAACFIYGSFSLGIKDFFYYIAFYRLDNASIFCGTWWYHLLRFLRSIIKSGIIPLVVLLILGIRFTKKGFIFYFFILYLFFSFLGIALGGSWYDHYYAQLLPPICILLGWEFSFLFQSKKKIIDILLIFTLLIFPFFHYILVSLHFGGFCCKNFYPIESKLTPKIVNYLEKNCNNTDEIYAFLYSDPSIYFLSKKRSALPYLFKTGLLYDPNHIKEFIDLIESPKRPGYLITYTEEESIVITNRLCEIKGNIIDKIETVLYGNFKPFCKDYPVQVSLIKQVFKTVPKYYLPVDPISFKDTVINIWKKRSSVEEVV